MNTITFESLGLVEPILSNLRSEGYSEPTPIQVKTIPGLLTGKDVFGCAQTGTGKTAAFALPIIHRLSQQPARRQPKQVRALVVAPTRELAAQIDASFAAYGRRSNLSRACVFGGVGKEPQVRAIARGVDILVATPGRLLDLHGDHSVRLDAVEVIVLDEADRMLDMGFIHDVRRIMALVPRERQTMLFSATLPPSIKTLADSILNEPFHVTISPERPTVELIDQRLMYVEKADKRALLGTLLRGSDVKRAIVFTRTKHGANRLAESLARDGITTDAIHSNKSQSQRTRTLNAFREGKLRVLVATDLAARGIDVDGITHVFNYELPHEPETYVHRIGRTARAGLSGVSVTLCDADERGQLRSIERLIGRKIAVDRDHSFAAGGANDQSMRSAPAWREPRPRPTHSARQSRYGRFGLEHRN